MKIAKILNRISLNNGFVINILDFIFYSFLKKNFNQIRGNKAIHSLAIMNGRVANNVDPDQTASAA